MFGTHVPFPDGGFGASPPTTSRHRCCAASSAKKSPRKTWRGGCCAIKPPYAHEQAKTTYGLFFQGKPGVLVSDPALGGDTVPAPPRPAVRRGGGGGQVPGAGAAGAPGGAAG